MADDAQQVTLRLSPEAQRYLEEIQTLIGAPTLAEAARRAIGDELFLLRERKKGWDVLLRNNGSYRAVKWPTM